LKLKKKYSEGQGYHGEKKPPKVLITRWLRGPFEQPFGYLRIAGVVLVSAVIPLSVAYMLSADPTRLHAENGPIEWLGFGFWAAGIVMCFLALSRHPGRSDRQMFLWFLLICALAGARELDAQILLNPRYLGQCGVHYKTRWFLSPEVDIRLKLFWASVFFIFGGIIISPLIVHRKLLLRLIRHGDVSSGLFLLSAICLATGFVFDDTLRKTTFLDRDVRQAIEEIAELLGAAYFLIGLCSLLWKPPSDRKGP
jgi:hypothetical protein